MPTRAERQQRIDFIRQSRSRLTALVDSLNDEQLNGELLPGEWSVRQIVHHLADADMNGFIRLKLVLSEDYPPLKPYAQALWTAQPDEQQIPAAASLHILQGLHERWFSLFESLTDKQWQRTGYHPENGDMTVDDLLVMYVGHWTLHYDQIEKTLAAQPK
jgi:uncharacterized damage-inducible protein DinB